MSTVAVTGVAYGTALLVQQDTPHPTPDSRALDRTGRRLGAQLRARKGLPSESLGNRRHVDGAEGYRMSALRLLG